MSSAPSRRLILASASQSRLRLLRAAGLDPEVVVTGVPEDDVVSSDAQVVVATYARRKAEAGARDVTDALVIGCDSMLQHNGALLGKPETAEGARELWEKRRNTYGTLLTGHCLIDTGSGRSAEGVCGSVVHFGDPTGAELDAYIATGEPLRAAGGFTIEGRSAPFVERVDGDVTNVLGLSLPTLRRLLAQLDVEITDLWV